jgi:hypothetical protein
MEYSGISIDRSFWTFHEGFGDQAPGINYVRLLQRVNVGVLTNGARRRIGLTRQVGSEE